VREGILGPPLEFVNADLHERAHLQHITSGEERSRAARTWADGRRATLLATRTPFATETVFSHPTKLDLIANAQRQGFTVALYVVALDDPQRLLGRVAQRVREGGHPVPPERILARYPRTLQDDCEKLNKRHVDFVFAPTPAEVYPQGTEGQTYVDVPGIIHHARRRQPPGPFPRRVDHRQQAV